MARWPIKVSPLWVTVAAWVVVVAWVAVAALERLALWVALDQTLPPLLQAQPQAPKERPQGLLVVMQWLKSLLAPQRLRV
jgi:hypothetical protein